MAADRVYDLDSVLIKQDLLYSFGIQSGSLASSDSSLGSIELIHTDGRMVLTLTPKTGQVNKLELIMRPN